MKTPQVPAMDGMTPFGFSSPLVTAARKIIVSARADGVTIDAGNVVDLIADNTEASLTEIEAALDFLNIAHGKV